MKASELANTSVATITSDETLAEAAHRLRENHVGDLVVLDENDPEGPPIGIITDRDVTIAVDEYGPEHVGTKKVRAAMTENLILGKADDPVEKLVQNMRDNGIRRIPIIDSEDDIVGIVTFDDLIGYYGDGLMKMAELVQQEISAEVSESP
ncbi:MAG: CBS domain-containing protein [Bradymonadaceae bacterium]